MSARKDLPPPEGVDRMAAAMRRRTRPPAETGGQDEAAPGATSATGARRRTSRTSARMDRRSWYMPRAVADALGEAVTELHFRTRRPKHEVLAALIAVALDRQDEAAARLRQEPESH